MNILNMHVSWFGCITDTANPQPATVGGILNGIYQDRGLSSQVLSIRNEADDATRKALKGQLPVIMWQGQFSQRSKNGLQSLSGIICMDFDHIGEEGIQRLKIVMSSTPWILAAFTSPSGDGLKVLVKTPVTNPTEYENCYRQLIDVFSSQFGCIADPNCINYAQGCYASHDPNIIVNWNVVDYPFVYDPSYVAAKIQGNRTAKTGDQSAAPSQLPAPDKNQRFLNILKSQQQRLSDEDIIKILDRRFHSYPLNYIDGNRTRSIFAQAAILCKAGIPEEKAQEYLEDQFLPTGYSQRKLHYEVVNAYYKNKPLFGTERANYLSNWDYKKYKGKKGAKP